MSDLEEKVTRWLASHGHPLEMRTARAFRASSWDTEHALHSKHAWEVNQSSMYLGSEGKWREADVVAHMRAGYPKSSPWRAFEFVAVVECKSNTSKPWIVFSAEDAGIRMDAISSRYSNSIGRSFLGTVEFDYAFDSRHAFFSVRERAGYGAVRAFEENNQDQAFGTMSAVTDAAQHWCRFSGNEHTMRCRLVFPIVVVSSPILECYLDGSGEMRLAPCDTATVFRHSKNAKRSYDIIDIVTESGLNTYIAQLTDLHRFMWQSDQEAITASFEAYAVESGDASEL